MSAPVRFLALVLAGWVGFRAATLGMIPGFTVSYAKETPRRPLPPIAATDFAPLPAVEAAYPQLAAYPPHQMQAYPLRPIYYPVFPYPIQTAAAQSQIPPRPQWQLSSTQGFAARDFYSPLPPLDLRSGAAITSAAFPERRSLPTPPAIAQQQGRLDRIQMSTWALLRGAPEPGALASGGTLGGSQAGARVLYAFNRWVAASLRTSSPLGGSRGAEVAGGIRVTPFRSIPVAFTAERRQSISPHGGGRSAFAFFAETGLYHQPMPWEFTLDAYLQAGVVGFKSRDLFIDGAMAFSRPVWNRFSAGLGVWGGAQPGVYRIDAGPRISVRVRDNIHAHVDWRQRVAGDARPGSGPAVTLAADF
jgi:hypothetical protein